MKRNKNALLLVAIIAAILSAFKNKTAHTTGNLVFLKYLGNNPRYVYSNSSWLSVNLICGTISDEGDCTFTSTATAAFFNNPATGFEAIPPVHNNTAPVVNYTAGSYHAYILVH